MYYIGQKVVCIDDKRQNYAMGNLKENTIYTVKRFHPRDGGLILHEAKGDGGFGAYLSERFMSLTDYCKQTEAIEQLFKELNLQVN
jgi:hypothetical protein